MQLLVPYISNIDQVFFLITNSDRIWNKLQLNHPPLLISLKRKPPHRKMTQWQLSNSHETLNFAEKAGKFWLVWNSSELGSVIAHWSQVTRITIFTFLPRSCIKTQNLHNSTKYLSPHSLSYKNLKSYRLWACEHGKIILLFRFFSISVRIYKYAHEKSK